MSAFSERLAAMTPREQVVLGGGLALALIIIVYTFAWEPWQAELQALRERVPEKQQTLNWMAGQVEQIRRLRQSTEANAQDSSLPLLTQIERSANRADIRKVITRMNPGENADQVRIWMDDADFDRWLRWLESLNENGIAVAEANVDRQAANQVTIRTTLQR